MKNKKKKIETIKLPKFRIDPRVFDLIIEGRKKRRR